MKIILAMICESESSISTAEERSIKAALQMNANRTKRTKGMNNLPKLREDLNADVMHLKRS
jgi:hypothetical protein